MTLSLNKASIYFGISVFLMAGLGYTPYIPYWTSNIIFFLLLAGVAILGFKYDFFLLGFFFLWMIFGLIPFFYTPINIQDIVLRCLKLMAPLLAYMAGVKSGINYGQLLKLCLIGFFVNAVAAAIQLFFLPHAVLRIEPGGAAAWQEVDFQIPLFAYRVTGFLGNPNALGAYMALLSAFFLGSRELRRKWIYLLLALLVAFVFAKSRNSTLILALMLLLAPIFNDRTRHAGICIVLAACFAFGLYFVDLSMLMKYFLRADVILDNINKRIEINRDGIQIWWSQAFLFGGGIASETYYMIRNQAAHVYTESAYVKLLLERGVLGFLLHASMLLHIYLKLKDRQLKDTMKYMLIAMAGISIFETVFYVKEIYLLVFFLLGCLIGIDRRSQLETWECHRGNAAQSSELSPV